MVSRQFRGAAKSHIPETRGCAGPPFALRQLVIALAEPVQAEREADAFFRGLEDDEGRGLGSAELAEQLVVHDDLGDAAIGQAADKAGTAYVLVVELEAEAGGQENAE